MRIVGGRNRGRRLETPQGATTRPTAERAREALFNILSHGRFAAGGSVLVGGRVLDLFAGSGALGLEALSRGAAFATFVDSDPAAIAAIRANLATLGETAKAKLLQSDATRLPPAGEPCTLVFLDPPYGGGLVVPALEGLVAQGWLAADGLAVVEVAAAEPFTPPPGFDALDERRYGAARLIVLARK